MEKKDTVKNKKYPLCRIPSDQLKKLIDIGGGHWRRGLTQVLSTYERMERDPTLPLLYELDHFADLVRVYLPGNHLEHWDESGMGRFLRCFIKTGKVDQDILWQKRQEKPIDAFEKKEEEEENDAESSV